MQNPSSTVWRALEIFEGADAIDMPGIVSALSAPLAHANIQMLFISSHKTDLILVPADSVDSAFKMVKSNLQKVQNALKAGQSLSPVLAATPAPSEVKDEKEAGKDGKEAKTDKSKSKSKTNGVHKAGPGYGNGVLAADDAESSMSLVPLPARLRLLTLNKKDLPSAAFAVLSLLFGQSPNTPASDDR